MSLAAGLIALGSFGSSSAAAATATAKMARTPGASTGLAIHLEGGDLEGFPAGIRSFIVYLPPGTQINTYDLEQCDEVAGECERDANDIGAFSATWVTPAGADASVPPVAGHIYSEPEDLLLFDRSFAITPLPLAGTWLRGSHGFDGFRIDPFLTLGLATVDLKIPAKTIHGGYLMTTPTRCPSRGWKLRVLLGHGKGKVTKMVKYLPCRGRGTTKPDAPLPRDVDPSVRRLARSYIERFDRVPSAVAAGTGNNGRVERSEWEAPRGRAAVVDGTALFRRIDGDGGTKDGIVTLQEFSRWIQRVEQRDGNGDGVLSHREEDHIRSLVRSLVRVRRAT